jgi:hypothetical protein
MSETLRPRDFVGYGRRWSAFEWPEGARLALDLVTNYEEEPNGARGTARARLRAVASRASITNEGRSDRFSERVPRRKVDALLQGFGALLLAVSALAKSLELLRHLFNGPSELGQLASDARLCPRGL